MTAKKQHMSNPKNFCQEAKKHGVTYEYLIEAKESINCTNLARMFIGKSARGGLSTDIIETWIATFEYAKDHPDEEDKDQYTARRFEPTQEYHDYVKLIKTPIPDDVVESWKKMSCLALGKLAPQYGYRIGIANNKALRTLHERMQQMADRRKNNIWNRIDEIEAGEDVNAKQDYRMMNINDLRKLCKERNLQNAHIKTKDGLIKLLERNPLDSVYEETKIVYDSMSMKDLKVLAKDRGFTTYNNLTKDELIKNHQEFDELEQDKECRDVDGVEESKECDDGWVEESKECDDNGCIEESKDNIVDGNEDGIKKIDVLIRHEDGYINATMLCKAGKKKFNDYHRLKQTDELLNSCGKYTNIDKDKLIKIKQGGISKSNDSMDPKLQGTWVHPLIATNLASWISSDFAIKVSIWIEEWKQNNLNKDVYYKELNHRLPIERKAEA